MQNYSSPATPNMPTVETLTRELNLTPAEQARTSQILNTRDTLMACLHDDPVKTDEQREVRTFNIEAMVNQTMYEMLSPSQKTTYMHLVADEPRMAAGGGQ